MKTLLVLAMHGAPPSDFPRQEMLELFDLHHRLERLSPAERAGLEERYAELERKMRLWPRTPQNDRFWAGSQVLAQALEAAAGLKVILGFNEFCAPSLDEALDQGAAQAERLLVLTPMMTRGGEHAEKDIPQAVQRARERHPQVVFHYLWPFETADVAAFLAAQAKKHLS